MKTNRKTKTIRERLREVIANDKGMILNVSLMLLGILTLLGVTAAVLAITDMKISGKYEHSTQSFSIAEAGLEEAKARLKGSNSDVNFAGDPAASYDPDWSAYLLTNSSYWEASDVDPHYNAIYKNYIPTTSSHTNTSVVVNSLQTNLTYWVKLQHKREYDAEQDGHTTSSPHYYDGDGSTATHSTSDPGRIIYYGYGNPGSPTTNTALTTSGATKDYPIEMITVYAHKRATNQGLQMEVSRNPGPPVNSSVYGKGNITVNGSGFISGNDNCGRVGAKPPIYTLSPATTTTAGSPTYQGSPATPQSGTSDIDVDDYVDMFKDGASVITEDQSGINFGNSSTFVTIYSNPSNPLNVGGLKIQNGTGYGILIVEGDLILGGGFNWDGIILVTGTLTLNGGGDGINIKGAVMATNTIDINGGLDIRYDSCQIDKALNSKPMVLMKWKQIY